MKDAAYQDEAIEHIHKALGLAAIWPIYDPGGDYQRQVGDDFGQGGKLELLEKNP